MAVLRTPAVKIENNAERACGLLKQFGATSGVLPRVRNLCDQIRNAWQLCAMRFNFERAVNRRAVKGLGGIAIDGIVIRASSTPSLGVLGANIGPLIILTLASVAWSVFLALVIGRRCFPHHRFEHSVAEFGASQGNVATAFVMVDIVDRARQTDASSEAMSFGGLLTLNAAGVATLQRSCQRNPPVQENT
jgi:hypothetical protein